MIIKPTFNSTNIIPKLKNGKHSTIKTIDKTLEIKNFIEVEAGRKWNHPVGNSFAYSILPGKSITLTLPEITSDGRDKFLNTSGTITWILKEVKRPCNRRGDYTSSDISSTSLRYNGRCYIHFRGKLAFSTLSNIEDSKSGKKGTAVRHDDISPQDGLSSNDTEPASSKKVEDVVGTEPEQRSVVLRKPIPRNFIKETLLPHLEHNIAFNSLKFPPDVMLQIGIAYSKLPPFVRQRSVEDALIESFRHRMVDYNVSDCIQLMNTSLQLQGLRSVAIYYDIITRLETSHVYNSITTLNRLGLCRSISRVLCVARPVDGNKFYEGWSMEVKPSIFRPWSFITSGLRDKCLNKLVNRMVTFGDRILPQLEYELQTYDPHELTDLLSVIAERTDRDSTHLDFPIVAILLFHIIRLYNDTPLVYSLSNFCNLCRLKIKNDEFNNLIINDLKNPLKMTNIYHKHLVRTLWALGKFGLLKQVLPDLLQHIRWSIPNFDPSGFARLAQVINFYGNDNGEDILKLHQMTLKSAVNLLHKTTEFNAKESIFFLVGCLYLKILPTEEEFTNQLLQGTIPINWSPDEKWLPKSKRQNNIIRLDVFNNIIDMVHRLDDDYDLWEIQRIITTIGNFKGFEYLITHLPKSWANITQELKNDSQ